MAFLYFHSFGPYIALCNIALRFIKMTDVYVITKAKGQRQQQITRKNTVFLASFFPLDTDDFYRSESGKYVKLLICKK